MINIKNNRAQATLFVILGVVIIIVIGFATYYFGIKPNNDVDQNVDIEKKLNMISTDCMKSLMQQEVESIISYGSVNGMVPNTMLYNDTYIYTLYDQDNDGIVKGFLDAYTLQDEMKADMQANLMDCIDSTHDALEKIYGPFDLELNSINIVLNKVQANAQAEFMYNNKEQNKTVYYAAEYPTALYSMISVAKDITYMYDMSVYFPDVQYNAQMCNVIYTNSDFKPTYPLDITKNIQQNPNVHALLEKDYMIITISSDNKKESMQFGIYPLEGAAFC